MRAVFAPGLRDRFELAVGRLAAFGDEMSLNRPHFVDVERKPPRSAQFAEIDRSQLANRRLAPNESIRRAAFEPIEQDRPFDRALDRRVREHAIHKFVDRLHIGARDPIRSNRTDRPRRILKLMKKRKRAFAFGIGHSRQSNHMNNF